MCCGGGGGGSGVGCVYSVLASIQASFRSRLCPVVRTLVKDPGAFPFLSEGLERGIAATSFAGRGFGQCRRHTLGIQLVFGEAPCNAWGSLKSTGLRISEALEWGWKQNVL